MSSCRVIAIGPPTRKLEVGRETVRVSRGRAQPCGLIAERIT